MLDSMDIYNLALRPNCLLTRSPIVFLNGPRSLFFYEKLGGTLQDYIQAHGYQVLNPTLAFRNKELRKHQLEKFLKTQNSQKFHFILGAQTQNEFNEIFKTYPESTFTHPEDFLKEDIPKPSTPLSYRFHQLLTNLYHIKSENYWATFPVKNVVLYERFLDHCIELAENEIYA